MMEPIQKQAYRMFVKRTYLSLILFIECMVAYAQNISVADFYLDENDLTANLQGTTVMDQNDEKCALIKVITTQTGFTFDVGSLGVQKVEQKNGVIWVYVPQGVRKMSIFHQYLGSLVDFSMPIVIEKAKTYVLKLIVGTVETIVTHSTQSGFFVINSIPEEAEVWIDEKFEGYTPLSKRYPLGQSMQYRISKNLYYDEVGNVSINGIQTKINTTLMPAFGSIAITSDPSDAEVYLDNQPQSLGKTPITINEVASGKHTIRIEKPMYAPYREDVEVQDGRKTTINGQLHSRYGTVTVKSLDGTSIYVDGEYKGITTVTINQMEGICEIEARLASHRTVKQQIMVEAGKESNISLKPTPLYGILSVESTPIGAEIMVDGKKQGDTPNIIEYLLVGDHNVLLKKDGFVDYSQKITVEEGKEVVINTKLREISSTLSLQEYESVMSSNNGNIIRSYLDKLSPTDKLYDEVSNKYALLLAQSFSAYSTEASLTYVLSYAKDDETRKSIRDSYNGQKGTFVYPKKKVKPRHNFNDEPITWAIELLDIGVNSKNVNDTNYLGLFNAGIGIRLGEYDKTIQYEFGVNPGITVAYDEGDETKFHMPMYLRLKWSLGRDYINIEGNRTEIAFYVDGIGYYNAIKDETIENNFSTSFGIGILLGKHFDWRIGYLKFDIDRNPNVQDGRLFGTAIITYL